MKQEFEIKNGKYISFKARGQERFTRAKTIGSSYTEKEIKNRIALNIEVRKNISQHNVEVGNYNFFDEVTDEVDESSDKFSLSKLSKIKAEVKASNPKMTAKTKLKHLHDLENQKFTDSIGLTKWAKKENLKLSVKSMNMLTEKGISSITELQQKIEIANQKVDDMNVEMSKYKNEIETLEDVITHLDAFKQTYEILNEYTKASDKEKFLQTGNNKKLLQKNQVELRYIRNYIKKTNLKYDDIYKLPSILQNLKNEKKDFDKNYISTKNELSDLQIIDYNLKKFLKLENNSKSKDDGDR